VKLVDVDIGRSPERAGHARLSGVVRYDDARGGPAEETYWFDFPDAFAGELSTSGNPWLAMLLPVAIVSNEALVLSRPVDARLFDSARELNLIWKTWFGDPVIRVEADVERPDPATPMGARTASYFSGGVDSFFTALRPRTVPVDDLILMLGTFDLMDADAATLDRVRARMQRAADLVGKTLLPVTTNQMRTRLAVTDPIRRSGFAFLAPAALALERRYSRVLMSANIDQRWKSRIRDDALMTQFLSTVRTRFEDDGNPYSRVDKVALIATSQAARETLRVCFESQREDNCMHCAKCFRTAVALEALGGLERWPTFGGKPLSVERVRRTTIAHAIERYYWQELPAFCREHGRKDLARAAERVLARARLFDPFRPFVRWLRRNPLVAGWTHRAESLVQDVDPLSLRPRGGVR